ATTMTSRRSSRRCSKARRCVKPRKSRAPASALPRRCARSSWRRARFDRLLGERCMAYVIEFYRDDRRMGTKPWPGDLAEAKSFAINAMSIQPATYVAVIDEDTRQIVFAYPEPVNGP